MFTFLISFLLSFFPAIAYADFKNTLPGSSAIIQPTPPPQPQKEPSQETQKATTPQNHSNDEGVFGKSLTQHNSNAPIYFEGDSADGSKKTGVLNLVGHAKIIQDDTTLTSDRAQLFSTPSTVDSNFNANGIQRAIATGNVHIFKKLSPTAPELKGVGDKLEFDVPRKILTLTGNAKVWRGKEYVNAHTIEINLDSGDLKLTGPRGTVDPRSAIQNSSTSSKDNTKKQNK